MTRPLPLPIAASALPHQIATLVRQIVPPVVAFAVGRGWLADDSATVLAALAGIVLPILDGQRRSLDRSRTLARLGALLPDGVAVVR